MRFLVANDQAAAQAINDAIEVRGRELFSQFGYGVDEQGDIIGKRVSDGVLQPSAQRTTAWDVPRQRLDGKWIISHPENQAKSTTIVDQQGTLASEYVMQDLAGTVIESDPENGTWFPLPTIP
jgi:hypothetical protein